ncbi:MAG TPA: serine/threonine-protein kinase [Alphaproteobacteria bacterium]|nr:serine/threonine-protein kinase [Alphaproteobacteria bacterium]
MSSGQSRKRSRTKDTNAAAKRKHRLPSGSVLRDCYRIKRVLGIGGFAITYLAYHTGLEQPVAIKEYLPDNLALRTEDSITVRPRLGEEQKFKWGLSRFTREARLLAQFSHPGIVPITDLFEANGTSYMVMEYVEGESLAELLERRKTLDEDEMRDIFEPILDALEEVHAQGILHRDIKPANIVVRENGSAVLLDFGCSRHTMGERNQNLTVALTPGYAPGEQYSSKGKQGPWTDIYAVGASIYRAISGFHPPEAPDRLLSDEFSPFAELIGEGYSAALLNALDYALAVKPEERPQDVTAFRRMWSGEAIGPATVVPYIQEEALAPIVNRARPAANWTSRVQGTLTATIFAALIGAGYLTWTEYKEAQAVYRVVAKHGDRMQLEATRIASERARLHAAIARREKIVETIRAEKEKEKEKQASAAAAGPRRKTKQSAQRPEQVLPAEKKQPYCRDVGGYEAYMKRTSQVCKLY